MLQSGRVAFGVMEAVAFGRPAAETVAEEARRRGAQRVFLMVSGTLNRTTDEIEKVRRALGNRCAGVFDRMPPHTPRQAVIEAAAMARDAGADMIATIGGGSITDGAKAVQLCLANDISSAEAIDRLRPVKGADGALGPPPDMKPPAVPQVTVPTTLSAGEFSAISGVTDERHRVKELIRHPGIMPRIVVLDPAVTVHTPEWLWLSTGIRAVDHCVEGICSGEANPYADAQALHGLSLLARGLPRVKADPADLEARLDCQIGSWLSMGPLASGVPMGASHGIGYVLGRDVRHPARPHLVHHAAGGDALEQIGQRRAPGAGRGRDGPSRRGCRRCARSVHRRARDAAQPRRGQDRARKLRQDGRAGNGHAVGAAQPAADRRPGAGPRDPGTGGIISLGARLAEFSGDD